MEGWDHLSDPKELKASHGIKNIHEALGFIN